MQEEIIIDIQAAAFDLITELESKTGLMTVDEVAAIFDISIRTVNRMITTRKIPSLLIAGNRKFDPAQLIRWVVEKAMAPEPGADMTEITVPLTKGQTTVINACDAHLLEGYKWSALWNPYIKGCYALGTGQETVVYLHRLVLGLFPCHKSLVDHISGVTLDNRRSNLRVATKAQNAQNRKMLSTNTSGYKGVTASGKKWVASITVRGKFISLGRFDTKEEAYEAYCKAATEMHGDFANLGVAV